MNSKHLGRYLALFFFSIFTIFIFAADIPTDDQIVKILTTTNDGEVAQAKLARTNAKSKQVKNFANHMIKEHSNNNAKSLKLAKRIKLSPEANETSMTLKKNSDEAIAKLKDLKGEEFDKAYMDLQIEEHGKVLSNLDTTLIPSAKNEKLKKMLEKTRTTVAKHLDDAKKIKTEL